MIGPGSVRSVSVCACVTQCVSHRERMRGHCVHVNECAVMNYWQDTVPEWCFDTQQDYRVHTSISSLSERVVESVRIQFHHDDDL